MPSISSSAPCPRSASIAAWYVRWPGWAERPLHLGGPEPEALPEIPELRVVEPTGLGEHRLGRRKETRVTAPGAGQEREHGRRARPPVKLQREMLEDQPHVARVALHHLIHRLVCVRTEGALEVGEFHDRDQRVPRPALGRPAERHWPGHVRSNRRCRLFAVGRRLGQVGVHAGSVDFGCRNSSRGERLCRC